MNSSDELRIFRHDVRRVFRPKEAEQLLAQYRSAIAESNSAVAGRIRLRLIENHQPLILRQAGFFSRKYNIPIADLVGVGNIGLIKAANKFNPSPGHQFNTYAIYWIDGQLSDYCKRERKVHQVSVKEDAALILDKAFFGGENDEEARIIYAMDAPGRDRIVTDALLTLSDRQREILTQHYLADPPKTLAEIGTELSISRERVRQLKEDALKKLRAHLHDIEP